MTVLDPRVRAELETAHAEAQRAGRLLSPERARAHLERFRQSFSPDALQRLDGEALLERMHGTGNKESLAYWLEFKDDDDFPGRSFGGIGGGSAGKFGIYRQRDTGQWVSGVGSRQRGLTIAGDRRARAAEQ